MIWTVVSAVAALVSMVTYVVTALYVRDQLQGQKKDRYLHVTNDLFGLWETREFMQEQLWLIHSLEATTWPEFVAKHRGDRGEVAFHRVGSFYDRVGTLARLGFVDEREILSTMGGYAIAVWGKIGPLVREARRIENSTLFEDFERLLPACHVCYVPALGGESVVVPFEVEQPTPRVAAKAVRRRLDAGEPLTVLDVRHDAQVDRDHPVLPGTIHIPVGEFEARAGEVPAGREAVVLCA